MRTLGVQIYEQKQPIHHRRRKGTSVNITIHVCPNVAREQQKAGENPVQTNYFTPSCSLLISTSFFFRGGGGSCSFVFLLALHQQFEDVSYIFFAEECERYTCILLYTLQNTNDRITLGLSGYPVVVFLHYCANYILTRL